MLELQCALAESDTAATARLLLTYDIATRLHQPQRDRLSAIAAETWPACPTDVRMVARCLSLVLFATAAS